MQKGVGTRSHPTAALDVICGRSRDFVHVVFVYLPVNEFGVSVRTTSYIYVLKLVLRR